MWTEQLVQGAGMAGSTQGQGRPYHAGPWDYTAELYFSPGVMGTMEAFKIGGGKVSLLFLEGFCTWRRN